MMLTMNPRDAKGFPMKTLKTTLLAALLVAGVFGCASFSGIATLRPLSTRPAGSPRVASTR